MQTLGLSDSTPRSESRWRALFWPTIRNETDVDSITRQGFWICFLGAMAGLVQSAAAGSIAGALEALYFFLAGAGVRERSRVAAIAAFVSYLLGAIVQQRYTGNGFGIVRTIFLALLFANIRGIWLSARWQVDAEAAAPPGQLSETLGDKLSTRLPAFVWPKLRHVFYVLAAIEVTLLVILLFVPIAAT